MKNFRSFLQEKCRIPDKKAPFYIRRVAKYYTYSKGCTSEDPDIAKSFLEALSQKYKRRQVKQTEKKSRI